MDKQGHETMPTVKVVTKAFAKVVGDKVNRGGGNGLEILCIYHLYGPKPYIDKMKELVDSLIASGLV